MMPLPRIRHNIIANFAGRAWASILGLAFVPIYIKLLGVEVYGLLGIFMSLGAILSLLDMGLSATLSRELSRLSATANSTYESRNLVRTMEVIYWVVGATIGATVILLADPIAGHWINSEEVELELVQSCLMIMGLSIAFQWPGTLYMGGLMGLERQIALNVIRSVIAVVQHVGAVIILVFVSPSVLAFFAWQALVGLMTTLALRGWLWKSLSDNKGVSFQARFDKDLLLHNWRFATGVTGISVTTVLLTQVDKIILSKILTLEEFGYYMLAFNVANALHNLVTPLVSSLYPRFTQLIATNEMGRLIALYHKGCQLLSVTVLPVAIVIAFFSHEIIDLWLNDDKTSRNTHLLLTLQVIGTAMNALVSLPYSLQLAYGSTRLVFVSNTMAVIVLVPLMIWMASHHQGAGAVWVWIILNTSYLVILVPIMHQRLKADGMSGWYRNDVILPGLVAFVIALCTWLLLPEGASALLTMVTVLVALVLSMGGAVLAADTLRKSIYDRWKFANHE